MVLNKFKCLLLATLLPFLLSGCSEKKEEKQSVNSQVREQDGLDAIYPQLNQDGLDIGALTSIKIDEASYDWQMGFKDIENLEAMYNAIDPDGLIFGLLNSHMIGYVSKSNKDYILVREHVRHIDDSKKTIEIADSHKARLNKFDTFMKSGDAASISYTPVVLKTSTESINFIRTNKGYVSDEKNFFPNYEFICQRFSVSGQLECEQKNVFINKHSEEIKNELRPIYVMYEAAKAGDFSKIKIGLAGDSTGDKTKYFIKRFNGADVTEFHKLIPQASEIIKDGPFKGAVRLIPEKLKELNPMSKEFEKATKMTEDKKAFEEQIDGLEIPGAATTIGEAAAVEAASP